MPVRHRQPLLCRRLYCTATLFLRDLGFPRLQTGLLPRLIYVPLHSLFNLRCSTCSTSLLAFEYDPDLRQQRDIILTEPPMKGRKPNITTLHGELDKAPTAPAWSPKVAKTEWDASYLRSWRLTVEIVLNMNRRH